MVMNEFTKTLDNHLTYSQKVPGRGKRYATEIWLDARDMTSYRALPFEKHKKNEEMSSWNLQRQCFKCKGWDQNVTIKCMDS